MGYCTTHIMMQQKLQALHLRAITNYHLVESSLNPNIPKAKSSSLRHVLNIHTYFIKDKCIAAHSNTLKDFTSSPVIFDRKSWLHVYI